MADTVTVEPDGDPGTDAAPVPRVFPVLGGLIFCYSGITSLSRL